ncbi:uncharacterized protein LOC110679209 [Aedes aegypti]|nr:uncharacterized protein LOC110679209 [Aedes aegypti]
MHKELCEELRHLRDQANALSVPYIKKERVSEIKAMVKQAFDTDILEDLDEDLESRLLDLDDLDIEMPVITPNEDVLDIDTPVLTGYEDVDHIDVDEPEIVEYVEVPSNGYKYDEETLDRLALAMDLYLQNQGTIAAQQAKEKSKEIAVESTTVDYTSSYPRTTLRATTMITPVHSNAKENSKDSWFGSLFGKENKLPVKPTIDVSQPAELIEPDHGKQKEQDAWIHKDVAEKNALEFDIDERFQTPANTENMDVESVVTHSVPIWLMKNAELDMDSNKEVDLVTINEEELFRKLPASSRNEAEAVDVVAAEDIEARELPTEEEELPVEEDVQQEHLDQETTSSSTETSQNEGDYVDGAATENIDEITHELSVEEEKPDQDDLDFDQQSITEIWTVEATSTEASHTENEAVEENVPELPIEEENVQVDDTATIEETSTKTEALDENTTEYIDVTTHGLSVEGEQPLDQQSTSEPSTVEASSPTTPVESHEEHTPPTTTAAPKPDARVFAKEEVFNVLSLLEETKGFTELKEHISIPDVDQLVDGLPNVEAGIRWTEMLSALQKMVTEKQLHSSKEIVDVLEHWKRGMKGQLDNGYFNRTYGGHNDVEVRELDDNKDDQFEARNSDTMFQPVDANNPEMAHLVPHIIQQLRLGNISEQEQLTLAAIFEDQWPLIVEEAFQFDQEPLLSEYY